MRRSAEVDGAIVGTKMGTCNVGRGETNRRKY